MLGKSKVYSAKLTSLLSRELVCKDIQIVIYKIQLANEFFFKSALMLARLTGH